MKVKLIGLVVFVLFIVVPGGYFLFANLKSKVPQNTVSENSDVENKELVLEANDQMEAEQSETNVYSLADVSDHNSEEDCWIVIDNKVYDVTEFIANQKHPGGPVILEGCGLDATELFNTRPMGSGTPHSDRARDGLRNYEIGELSQ